MVNYYIVWLYSMLSYLGSPVKHQDESATLFSVPDNRLLWHTTISKENGHVLVVAELSEKSGKVASVGSKKSFPRIHPQWVTLCQSALSDFMSTYLHLFHVINQSIPEWNLCILCIIIGMAGWQQHFFSPGPRQFITYYLWDWIFYDKVFSFHVMAAAASIV